MKRVFYFLTLSTLFLFTTSCDDDDGPTCTQADFLGTYVTTSSICDDPDADIASDTYTITAGSADNEIMIDDNDGFIQRATIDGCNFNADPVTEFGFTNNTTGSVDGNTLTFTDRITVDGTGVPFLSCTFVGEK